MFRFFLNLEAKGPGLLRPGAISSLCWELGYWETEEAFKDPGDVHRIHWFFSFFDLFIYYLIFLSEKVEDMSPAAMFYWLTFLNFDGVFPNL